MSLHRHALILGATAATLTIGVAAPAAAGAAEKPAAAAQSDLLGFNLPIISTLPIVGPILGGPAAGTPTTLPSIPGLEVLTGLLDTLPIIGGSDPATAIPGLPALSILSEILGAAGGTGGTGGTDPLALLTGLLPDLEGLIGGITALPGGGLAAGQVPTGAALEPVTGLLHQLAATLSGLPAGEALGAALESLADQIDAVGDGGVSPDLLAVLASTLGSIANTAGVPSPVQGAAAMLATQLAPKPVATTQTKTPVSTLKPGSPGPAAAAAIGSARLASLRVDRKAGVVRIALTCPATGPTCKTFVAGYRGTTQATAISPLLSIAPGATLKRSLKIKSASRRLLKKKTVKFSVSAALPGGKLSTRTVTAKLPKAKKAATKPR